MFMCLPNNYKGTALANDTAILQYYIIFSLCECIIVVIFLSQSCQHVQFIGHHGQTLKFLMD